MEAGRQGISMGISMDYLLIATILVPGGSILISKVMVPETQQPEAIENIVLDNKGNNHNVIEALMNGAGIGLKVIVNICVAVIVIVGMVSLINMFLGFAGLSLEMIFGYIVAPIGFFMGFDGAAAMQEGVLLGQKMVLNEFIAFADLGSYVSSLDTRTAMMCTISLAGFANVGSVGMCIGSMGALCPEKKDVISRCVVKGMLGGMLVSIFSAMLCGLIMLF